MVAGLKHEGVGSDASTPDGSLPRDADRVPVQIAKSTQYQDSASSPSISPKTVAGTAIELVIPQNAIAISMVCDTADVRFGDNATLDGTGTGKGYDILVQGERQRVPVAGGDSLYVVRDASTSAVLYFHFELL